MVSFVSIFWVILSIASHGYGSVFASPLSPIQSCCRKTLQAAMVQIVVGVSLRRLVVEQIQETPWAPWALWAQSTAWEVWTLPP